MALHHLGEEVAVLRAGKGADGLDGGQGLEAELGAEAEKVLAVLGVGLQAVPHVPVVAVPPVLVHGVVKAAPGGGGGGPVEHVGGILLHRLGQVELKLEQVVPLERRGVVLHVRPLQPGHLHLVVAADEAQTGVVAEAEQVVPGLGHNIVPELIGQVVDVAGKHKVLPEDDAVPVAQLVKVVAGVVAAPPHPQAVKVGKDGGPHVPLQHLMGDVGIEAVVGDVVGPPGEDLLPVDLVGKLLAPPVLVLGDGEGTKAQGDLLPLHLTPGGQFHLQGVQGLLPVAVGPPELGLLHGIVGLAALIEHRALRVFQAVGEGVLPLPLQAGGEAQLHLAVLMVLAHQGVPQLHLVPTAQLNGPVHPQIGEDGAPVPAEHTVGLAQVALAQQGAGVGHGDLPALGGLAVLDVLQGGEKPQLQGVLPRMEEALAGEGVHPVHVLHVAHLLPVKVQVGDGVHTVEGEVNMLFLPLLLRDRECAPQHKVVSQKLGHFILVGPEEGIRNAPLPEKHRHGGAGDGAGILLLLPRQAHGKPVGQISFHTSPCSDAA